MFERVSDDDSAALERKKRGSDECRDYDEHYFVNRTAKASGTTRVVLLLCVGIVIQADVLKTVDRRRWLQRCHVERMDSKSA